MREPETISLPKETKKDLVESIKSYFLNEREEEIGDLSAALLLDFFVKNIGPLVYNQAISDAYALMNEKIEDLYGLEKRLPSITEVKYD